MSRPWTCAACQFCENKCPEDCFFAPYFPPNSPQRFASIHQVYGAGNFKKILQEVPSRQRAEAAESMIYEASMRVRDPVYGCVRIISHLQQQINMFNRELAKTQGEIAEYRAAQPAEQEQQMTTAQVLQGEPSCVNETQQDLVYLDHQQQIKLFKRELAKTQGEIANHRAAQPAEQEQQMTTAQVQQGEPSCVNETQQDLVYLDHQQQIKLFKRELAKTHGEIANHRAAQPAEQEQQMTTAQVQQGEPSCVNETQQDLVHLDHQQPW